MKTTGSTYRLDYGLAGRDCWTGVVESVVGRWMLLLWRSASSDTMPMTVLLDRVTADSASDIEPGSTVIVWGRLAYYSEPWWTKPVLVIDADTVGKVAD